MSCCCCTKTLFLCSNVGTCEDDVVGLGISAKVAGVHKMKLDFLGDTFIVEATLAVNDSIEFPTKGLNENYTFTAQVYDPNGVQIVITKDLVEYDCISFSTVIVNTIPT